MKCQQMHEQLTSSIYTPILCIETLQAGTIGKWKMSSGPCSHHLVASTLNWVRHQGPAVLDNSQFEEFIALLN